MRDLTGASYHEREGRGGEMERAGPARRRGTAAPVGVGFSKSLRFESASAAFGVLRVGSAACGTVCTAADQYHMTARAY
jgi:hypothetical protein